MFVISANAGTQLAKTDFSGLRSWTLDLIETGNPGWRDLAEDFGFPAFGESI